MTVGGEVHSDEEAALIDDGSAQAHLWGINLYPGEEGTRGSHSPNRHRLGGRLRRGDDRSR